MPGSAGDPSEAIVVPSARATAGSVAATAAARSASLVVSNCAAVTAVVGGGGGGVGSSVGAGSATIAADSAPKNPCKEGDVQLESTKAGRIKIILIRSQYVADATRATGPMALAQSSART